LRNKAFKCCLFSSSGFSKIACLGSSVTEPCQVLHQTHPNQQEP
jgi:hypothetical protein